MVASATVLRMNLRDRASDRHLSVVYRSETNRPRSTDHL